MDTQTAGTIVKVISVLLIISAVLGVIGGVIMIFGGSFAASLIPLGGLDTATNAAAGAVSSLVVVVGIIVLLVSIFEIIVGVHLWKYRNWARIVTIVLAVIGIIGALFSLPIGLIMLVIDALVLYFLAFSDDIRALFVPRAARTGVRA